MKKRGFTLAEILVALGIVGVVSALTLPTFVNNANSKAHEATAKATVNAIENAIGTMLANDGVNIIPDLEVILNKESSESLTSVLVGEIKKSLKCSDSDYMPAPTSGGDFSTLLLKNGSSASIWLRTVTNGDDPGNTCGWVIIDTNVTSSPNKLEVDQFRYRLLNGGTLEKEQ